MRMESPVWDCFEQYPSKISRNFDRTHASSNLKYHVFHKKEPIPVKAEGQIIGSRIGILNHIICFCRLDKNKACGGRV